MLDLQVTDPIDPEVCESLNLNITMMIQVIWISPLGFNAH